MESTTHELLAIARRYCATIEALDRGDRQALVVLNEILPRLHAAMNALTPPDGCSGDDSRVDLDQRFELFSRLRRSLGDLDGYWMEFDVTPDGQEMSGSLADDLTDIYWELKIGLRRLERGQDAHPTLQGWRLGFCKHWGQHVVDAERHLYSLSARDRLY
jgi:hypothetical protein